MKPGLAEYLERHSLSGVPAYVVTGALVVATTGARIAMNPVFGDSAPYAFQAVAALAISALAGLKAGMFGIFLAVTIGWFIVPPYDLPLHQKIANEITVLLVGSLICLVTSTMRDALINAERSRREADFLSREMHHRVKNLFAVVASMTTLSARERPNAQTALVELRERVQALSNAHDVALSDTTFVTLKELMRRLMSPYLKPKSNAERVLFDGKDLEVPYGCVTPLGLVFHEMATNAVKYGALGCPDGYVRLSWKVRKDMLEITWQEHGAEPPAEEGVSGFGTVLIDASVAQMRGTLDRDRNHDGIVLRLSFPLHQGHGIQFPTDIAGASQDAWERSRSFLSAHPASKRFFRRKPATGDSRS